MDKLLRQTGIDTTTPIDYSKLVPQLFIPSEMLTLGGNRFHFPDYNSIKLRLTVQDVQIVDDFVSSILVAERVWIIDRHLFSDDGKKPDDRRRIDKVLNWFLPSQVQTVRIMTGWHKDQEKIRAEFRELEKIVEDLRDKDGPALRVDLSFALEDFGYVHDRFAIIDDELWHFGATVGGFHRNVNAVSRGWSAEALKAVQFFDTVWNISSANGSR